MRQRDVVKLQNAITDNILYVALTFRGISEHLQNVECVKKQVVCTPENSQVMVGVSYNVSWICAESSAL